MKWLSLLMVFLLCLSCGKDKAVNTDESDPGSPTYEVYVYNRAGSHGVRLTINGHQYSLAVNQTKRIGSFSGVCHWKAERADGYHGNYTYFRVGSGDVTIDHESSCYIYETWANWR